MGLQGGPLQVHKDRFEWLDTKWVLGSLTVALSVPNAFLVDLPGYAATVLVVVLALLLFCTLTALRGRLKSKWIKEVLEHNEHVFFDLAMALEEGRARGLWSDSGHDQQMNETGARYASIRRQMVEQLDVRLPACSSVCQVDEVIEDLGEKSQSYAGLRQIRSGRFAQRFKERGFGLDV